MHDQRARAVALLKLNARREAAGHARELRALATQELAAFDHLSRLEALLDGAQVLESDAASKGALTASMTLLTALGEQRKAAEAQLHDITARRPPIQSKLNTASLRQQVLGDQEAHLRARAASERVEKAEARAAECHATARFRTLSNAD
ncbi:MAG: hypothetical protein MK180_07010 [Rhodobacteraceae bacterium]|nr:hypothetical protein [Paracoccaceae bacterium]